MTSSFELLAVVAHVLVFAPSSYATSTSTSGSKPSQLQEGGLPVLKRQAAIEYTLIDKLNCIVTGDDLADKFTQLSNKAGLAGSGDLCKVDREENDAFLDAMTNLTCSSCDVMYGFIQQLLVNLDVTTQCCLSNGSACNAADDKNTADPAKAYGYGFLMVAGITLLSLLQMFLLPFLNDTSRFHRVYPYANTLLIALGTSALFCSAILHLLPEAIEIEQSKKKVFIWKGVVIIAGLYILYLFEVILHSFGGSHNHNHGNNSACEPTIPHGPCHDVHSELGNLGTKEESSDSNHIGDHVDNRLDTINTPFVLQHDEKSKLIESGSEKSNSFSCRSIKPLAWTIITGDAIHNFADGLTLGAAISQSLSLGMSTAIAIAFHEIPHELGDYAILLSSGLSWYMALLISFISNTTAIVGFFMGVAIGTESQVSTQWILTIAVGLFLYVALVDLLPELIHFDEKGYKRFFLILMTNIGFFISFLVILLIGVYEEQLNDSISI